MTDFVPAADVHSPQDRWTLKKVVYDEGERMFAIAVGVWKLENGKEQVRLAMRWNGHPGKPNGVPSAFNHATWFILPDPLAVAIADATLRLILRSGADDTARENARLLVEWTDKIEK